MDRIDVETVCICVFLEFNICLFSEIELCSNYILANCFTICFRQLTATSLVEILDLIYY